MGKSVAIGSLVLALAGCDAVKEMFKPGTITGKVESKGELGDWTLDKGLCFSGEKENYYGAVARGPDNTGIGIKMVKDPTKGWSVLVNNATSCVKPASPSDCKAIIFTAEGCKKLEADVETTNMTVNGVKVVHGKLAIDCEAGTSSVKGELKLTHCH